MLGILAVKSAALSGCVSDRAELSGILELSLNKNALFKDASTMEHWLSLSNYINKRNGTIWRRILELELDFWLGLGLGLRLGLGLELRLGSGLELEFGTNDSLRTANIRRQNGDAKKYHTHK